MKRVEVLAPDGLGEVRAGDDLAELILSAIELRSGDIVVVTSKVVSKSEGLTRAGGRANSLESETLRVVARHGTRVIVRTRHGLTLASAGIDGSNVPPGSHILLPRDPDASARRLRSRLAERSGLCLAIVITDTAGRPWREGQTDIAIGAAGLTVAPHYAGRLDQHGNALNLTRPAVADEIAGAAELAQGKVSARPIAVLRGRDDLVLPGDDPGEGASGLLRPAGADLFGFGAREAVVRALAGNAADQDAFGSPAEPGELELALRACLSDPDVHLTGRSGTYVVNLSASAKPALRAVCFAHGWQVTRIEDEVDLRITAHLRPTGP